MNFIKKLLFLLLIVGILPTSTIFGTSATAAEPWKISVLSSLKNIDQFENRELVFEVKINDKKVIEFLNKPNTEIIGSVVLAPLEVQQIPTLDNNTSSTYTCYNPKPKALSGFTGGSALRMQKSGNENETIAKFSCWFPQGMRAQEYSLTISLSLNLNGSCCSMPNPNEWDNLQVFMFGNAPDNFRPNGLWQRFMNNAWTPMPFATVNRIPEFEKVIVVRSQPKTDPINLTFNFKNISEITEALKKKTEVETQNTELFSSSLDNLINLSNTTQSSIKSLMKQYPKSKYLKDLSSFELEISKIRSQLDSLRNDFESLQLGSIEEDIRLKYLYGLDFDVKSKPEVLVAQYPDFKNVVGTPTPYIRFVIKSKTAIINADISPAFSSNVYTLGSQPVNDGWGGGLALVENQQWDGSLFITSILVGPKYTPVDPDTLNRIRSETCTSGWFRDAAGNISTYWNYDIPKYKCLPLPEPTQALSAAKDFDNLVVLYRELANSNENLQKIKFLSESLKSKAVMFPLFKEQIELLNSRTSLLSSQIKSETAEIKKIVKTTITCIKNKKLVKVTAVSPKCPVGFVRK